MPGPLLIPAIAAGASLIGTGINAASNANINKKTRKWNEKMHNLTRQESLADYQMQNEYNHPSSQMARLREAGLNPNLVYGEGAVANNASPVKSAPVESWNPRPNEYNIGGAASAGIAAYMDMEIKKATVDNLRSQNSVLEQEKYQKLAQTLGILSSTEATKFDLSQRQRLADTAAEAAEANVANIRAQTRLTITENEVKQAMKQPTIEKMLTEIINIKKDTQLKQSGINVNSEQAKKIHAEADKLVMDIHNAYLEGELKQFELELKKLRGSSSDWPGYMKVIYDAINEVMNLGSKPDKLEGYPPSSPFQK